MSALKRSSVLCLRRMAPLSCTDIILPSDFLFLKSKETRYELNYDNSKHSIEVHQFLPRTAFGAVTI